MAIKNHELISGDICQTVPTYIEHNPGFKVALMNLDCDFVEPTITVLEKLYPHVSRGGIILLDNYGGEGTSGLSYHGDTKGVDTYLEDKNIKIHRFPFASRPCYIIKD